jgi:hypothetical protein
LSTGCWRRRSNDRPGIVSSKQGSKSLLFEMAIIRERFGNPCRRIASMEMQSAKL